jgi:ABC-type multidrug transport system permease subunit
MYLNHGGLLIGACVPNASVGQGIGPFVVAIMLLFGGQLVNLSNIPAAFKWIQYVAIISYSNKAFFTQNEFTGLQFTCPANSTQCIPV